VRFNDLIVHGLDPHNLIIDLGTSITLDDSWKIEMGAVEYVNYR
jgi:hypothetical protein